MNYKIKGILICIVVIFVIFLASSIYYISRFQYEMWVQQTIDNVDISFLSNSEQEIGKRYSISTLQVEYVDTYFSDLDKKIDIVQNIFSVIPEELNTYIYKEEYRVGNHLASRDVSNTIGNSEESKYRKYYRLFGDEAVSYYGHVMYYETEEEAESHMVGLYVYVWDLDENNEWYKRKCYLAVHENLKTTVQCIFKDLLDLPEEERTPINSIGCYNYREGYSCHTCGAAFDINPRENAEMTISGVITCGEYWKPYEDIYSITPDSKLVEIFAKYGYGWGGDWVTKKDYMHFSYFDR